MQAKLIGVKNFSVLEETIQYASRELNTNLAFPTEENLQNLNILRAQLFEAQQVAGLDLTMEYLQRDTSGLIYQDLYTDTVKIIQYMAEQVANIQTRIEDRLVLDDKTLQGPEIMRQAAQAIFEHEKQQAEQANVGRVVVAGNIYQLNDDVGNSYFVTLGQTMISELQTGVDGKSVNLHINDRLTKDGQLNIARTIKEKDGNLIIENQNYPVKEFLPPENTAQPVPTIYIAEQSSTSLSLKKWLETPPQEQRALLQKIPIYVRLEIAAQLAQLVEQLHQADPPVVHRSIDLDNINLNYDNQSKTFTLSLITADTLSVVHGDMTEVGPNEFSPPEQIAFPAGGIASDNYALGAVIANIIAGNKRPTDARQQEYARLEQQADQLNEQQTADRLQAMLDIPIDLRPVNEAIKPLALSQRDAVLENLHSLVDPNKRIGSLEAAEALAKERAQVDLNSVSNVLHESAEAFKQQIIDRRQNAAQPTDNSAYLQTKVNAVENRYFLAQESMLTAQAVNSTMPLSEFNNAQPITAKFVVDLNADSLSEVDQARIKHVLAIETKRMQDSGTGYIIPAGTHYFIENNQGQVEKVVLGNSLISRESYRHPGQARFETVSDQVLGAGHFGEVVKAAKKYKLSEEGELRVGDAKKIIKYVDQESENNAIIQDWTTHTIAPEKVGFAQYDKFFQRESSDKPAHNGRIAQTALGSRYNTKQGTMVRTVVFTQPFFQGVSLNSLLQQGLPQDESFRIQLVKNLVEILVKLQEANVVHHDFNPGNLIVNPETAEVYLVDFGLARAVGSEQSSLFVYSMVPPEIVTLGYKNQPGYDAFSMGIIILTILTNFTGKLLEDVDNENSPLYERLRKSVDEIIKGLKQNETFISTDKIFNYVNSNLADTNVLQEDERATIKELVNILLSPDVKARENLDLTSSLMFLEQLAEKYPVQSVNVVHEGVNNLEIANNIPVVNNYIESVDEENFILNDNQTTPSENDQLVDELNQTIWNDEHSIIKSIYIEKEDNIDENIGTLQSNIDVAQNSQIDLLNSPEQISSTEQQIQKQQAKAEQHYVEITPSPNKESSIQPQMPQSSTEQKIQKQQAKSEQHYVEITPSPNKESSIQPQMPQLSTEQNTQKQQAKTSYARMPELPPKPHHFTKAFIQRKLTYGTSPLNEETRSLFIGAYRNNGEKNNASQHSEIPKTSSGYDKQYSAESHNEKASSNFSKENNPYGEPLVIDPKTLKPIKSKMEEHNRDKDHLIDTKPTAPKI
ncbi:MAG: hypothetical protein Tsb005_15820 [Gammaproteobacteria bacterium]